MAFLASFVAKCMQYLENRSTAAILGPNFEFTGTFHVRNDDQILWYRKFFQICDVVLLYK